MPTVHENDLLVVHNPLSISFSEKWGGEWFSVPANGEKVYPRFLAQHLAKHITNAALLEKEEQMARDQGVSNLKHSLLNNTDMRSALEAQILPKVYQYYLDQPHQSEAERLAKQIEETNINYVTQRQTENSPPPAEIAEDPVINKPTTGTTTEVSLFDKRKSKPTKLQLIEDCEQLGIKLKGNESYGQLLALIKAF